MDTSEKVKKPEFQSPFTAFVVEVSFKRCPVCDNYDGNLHYAQLCRRTEDALSCPALVGFRSALSRSAEPSGEMW